MSKIKLNLQRLTIPEKIARSQQIVAAMTGNANFTSPQPALPQVTTAINDLDTAYAATQTARQEAKTRTSIQNQKEEALDRVLTQLANYVESVSGDDEAKITSAGMNVRAEPAAAGDLAAPTGLEASVGDRDGEIDLVWDKVNKARSYVIERSADPPTATSWTHAAVATKSQATVGGLTSGTKYWFRVAAVGPNGQSPWSDPATKLAP
ncbi:MAG: hypothetical protein QOH63_3338 [Acidobacteriota bacterium]|jgi:hypothetical protein|nr:hypothetical protein [Acidobacteriota bacterium]